MKKLIRPFVFALLLTLLYSAPDLVGQPVWEPVGPGGDFIYDIDVSASGTLYATGSGQAYIRRASDTAWSPFEFFDSLWR